MSKPSDKDQYGPPLGSPKVSSPITNKATPSTPNKGKNILLPSPVTPTMTPRIRKDSIRATMSSIINTPLPPSVFNSPLVNLSNKFTPLSYHNTLIGPKDFISQPKEDDHYIEKDDVLEIIPLEKAWNNHSPKQLASSLFPPNFHYLPHHPSKTRTFYEFILVDTDSIEITHNKDDKGNIQFSKIKILQILSPSEWNQPLYKYKSFSRTFNPQQYNYYDYMEAWRNVLYLSPDSHSWFIWFKRGISLKFPKWFMNWFIDFGPLPSFFPPQAEEVYQYFKENSTFVQGYRFISFIATQGIAWILSWDYVYALKYDHTDLKVLARQIKIKWWKKFNLELLSKQKINEWLKFHKEAKLPEVKEATKEAIFLAEKQKIMAELASATSQEEFEERLKLVRAIQDPTVQEESDESTSQSNPYLRNGDMFD